LPRRGSEDPFVGNSDVRHEDRELLRRLVFLIRLLVSDRGCWNGSLGDPSVARAGHWAGKSRHIPACLPEKYGRSYGLPVKVGQNAGIWPIWYGPDKREVGG